MSARSPETGHAAPGVGRSRRRPEQVRALLLEATARLVGERGLAVSTRDIAAAAGVSENSLFRHFPTKVELVAAAVVEPFTEFVRSFRRQWERQRTDPLGDEELMRALVEDVYLSLRKRRELTAAMVVASMDPAAVGLRQRLTEALDELFVVLRRIGEDRSTVGAGFDATDVELSIRLHIGMIMTSVLMGEVLLSRYADVGADRLVDHMARLNLYGIAGPPVPRES